MADLPIRIRSYVRGTDDDVRQGLLGWLSVFYGSLIIDGIAIRRTAAGRMALAFPERTSKKGERHSIIAPINAEARRAIEAEIFKQATEVQP